MSRHATLEAPSIGISTGTRDENDDTVELPLPISSLAGDYADGLPQLSRCEIDPEMYQVFAYAVLGWHRRLPKRGGDMCRCGKSWLACEYVDLADKLLWTGAATWSTGNAIDPRPTGDPRPSHDPRNARDSRQALDPRPSHDPRQALDASAVAGSRTAH